MRPRPVVVTGRPKGGLAISSAMIAGDFVFVSGHVGWVPETREAPRGIRAQREQTLENIQSALEAAGTSFEYVCKRNLYLTNIDEFPAMDEVYRKYFPENPPARTTVAVALGRPDLLIEVEAVAMLPGKA